MNEVKGDKKDPREQLLQTGQIGLTLNRRFKMNDCDYTTKGDHDCGRCAKTGKFITGMLNGKPTGPGGICFRCNGKGHHNQADRRRNDYYDTHQTITL